MSFKGFRLRAGLSQQAVAKKLDVDQSAISKWENGANKPLRKYHKKLAKLYGVTVDELLEKDGKDSA